MWNERTEILIGKDGVKTLENSTVAIIGVGGVGGYVCTMLARAGVGNIIIVDFDKVDETNINRQIVANVETVGKEKVFVLKDMIEKINPKCKITAICERFSAENAERILKTQHIDYVVDAIDSTKDKIDLICYCKENDIKIVSSMGAGNRFGIPQVEIMDIYKTSNDGLAKTIRKNLRERRVKKLDVAIAKEIPLKIDRKTQSVGSISYYPAIFGCVLSSFVVNKLLEK